MTADELARACADAMWAEDHASRGRGVRLEHIAPNAARLSMPVTQAMVNGHGTCHGGYLFALADSAFGFACNTENQRQVAAQCAITFLRPAHLGDTLIATAEHRASAGRTSIYDVGITVEGLLIAEFRGHSRSIGQTFFEELP